MWKNNMQAIANIGSLTRPKYVKMPTLDLAGAIDDYYNSKDAATARVDAEAEKQRRQAMVDEMTAQHPEAAAQIAADPMGYAKMLEERAKAERDQQFKMDMLNRQFSNSMALADRQHANSVGLAKMRDELQNQAAANAKAQRAAELDEALNSGMITKEQYNLAKQRELLGDIVNGGKGGTFTEEKLPEGVTLTGNKKYDDAYMQEIGKKAAQKAVADRDMEEMKPTLIQSMAKADKAAKSGNGVGLLGGFAARLGLNPAPNAGFNYADIETANTQMNTFLRKQLAATGLTGSELNSAVEAEAYRYQIKPTDSESIIKRKLQNFAEDKLGITDFVPSPIKTVVGNIKTYGKKIKQSGKDWSKVSNEDLMKGL
jgi:hypothetical protein